MRRTGGKTGEGTELRKWIELAEAANAEQLLITAGKKPTLRLKKKLQEVSEEPVLHIQDIAALVRNLLTEDEFKRLDEQGDIRINLRDARTYQCHVAKSVGSFIVLIDLKTFTSRENQKPCLR